MASTRSRRPAVSSTSREARSALVQSEAELAGVLGARDRPRRAEAHDQRHPEEQGGRGRHRGGGRRSRLIDKFAQMAYSNILENSFDRGDEMDADKVGITAANKAGYAPQGLNVFLTRLAERNKAATTRNGMFASHPDLKARQDGITKTIEKEKLTATATVEARYKTNITYTPAEVTEIPTVAEGAAGLVSGGKTAAPTEDQKKQEKEAEQKKRASASAASRNRSAAAVAGTRSSRRRFRPPPARAASRRTATRRAEPTQLSLCVAGDAGGHRRIQEGNRLSLAPHYPGLS